VSAWWFQVEDSTWLCQPQGTVDFLVVSTWWILCTCTNI
jgi:hypothetical protein